MIFTTIVATLSIMGLITAGANTAGTIHDKAIIDESLSIMRDQATALQDQADNEKDPEVKRAKLRIAETLSKTQNTLSDLNEAPYKRKLSNEAFGLAKGLLTPKIPGSENLSGISVSTQDALMAAKAATGDGLGSEVATWKNMANTSTDSEIAILIAKARAMSKDLEKVSVEVESKYIEFKDLEEKEKSGLVDSNTVDSKLAELVSSDGNFRNRLLNNNGTVIDEPNYNGPNGGVYDDIDEPDYDGPNGGIIDEFEDSVQEINGNMAVSWGYAHGSINTANTDWDAEWEIETKNAITLTFRDPYEKGQEGSYKVEVYSEGILNNSVTVVNSNSVSLASGSYTIKVLPIGGYAGWNCEW